MKKIFPNTRVLCNGMRGQNYWFHGCMEYLMECLGESREYDYWFFSGVSGDSFTQIYSKIPSVCAWYYTKNTFNESLLNKVFEACGYEYEYIRGVTDETRGSYIPRIKESVDSNIPVITRGDKDLLEPVNICGYDGDDLYYLICDNAEPKQRDNKFTELIFTGKRTERPSLADAYRQAVMNIPCLITMPSTAEYSFGKSAFIDWADSFQNGTFDNIPPENIDVWRVHGTYLCLAGTNGCSRGFLQKALELNPDMEFIKQLEPVYAKHGDVFETLAYRDENGKNDYRNGGMQGGFKIKPEIIKNKELMKPISGKIMESATHCDKILKIFADVNG